MPDPTIAQSWSVVTDPYTVSNLTIPAPQDIGSSSSSGVAPASGDYGGGEPDVASPVEGQSAIDTSDGRVWWYYSGGWH